MTAVYLDACMVIYLVEGERIHQDLLVRQMRGKRIVTSELVRLEARIKAIRENARHHLTVYAAGELIKVIDWKTLTSLS